jgi:hypothetical protein
MTSRGTSRSPETREQRPRLKFEVQHAPNLAVAADRDPRERGSRPLNTDR